MIALVTAWHLKHTVVMDTLKKEVEEEGEGEGEEEKGSRQIKRIGKWYEFIG